MQFNSEVSTDAFALYTEYCGVPEGSNTFSLDISPRHSPRQFPGHPSSI